MNLKSSRRGGNGLGSKSWNGLYEQHRDSHTTRKVRYSYGIACCRYNKYTKKWNILLVRKRNTYSFVMFVLGRYITQDDYTLRHLFNNMTRQEKIDILSLKYNLLWYKIWLELPDESQFKFDISSAESIVETLRYYCVNNTIPYKLNNTSKIDFYKKQKSKFESLFMEDRGDRLRSLIEGSKDINLPWEIPKGRKNRYESRIECCIREFKEETGMDSSNYNILFDTQPIKEVIHTAGVTYIHYYHLAFAHKHHDPPNVFTQYTNMCEIDAIKWVDTDEIMFITNGCTPSAIVEAINTMKGVYSR